MFPAVSVAEQVTVVVPSANVLPDAGVHVGVSGPSTSSVADALKVTGAPPEPVASVEIGPGTVTTGGVVSGGGPTGSTTSLKVASEVFHELPGFPPVTDRAIVYVPGVEDENVAI